MAAGVFTQGFSYTTTPGLSANVPGDHVLPQGAFGGRHAAARPVGPLTSARPISIRSIPQTGVRAASFANDWYNRIHVLPRLIDFGAVTGGAIRATLVWNAYLSPSTLSSVVETGAANLTMTGPSGGKVFQPLEFATYTVAPQEAGPATIDTTYSFVFSGRSDVAELNVTGRRARLWPFAPNWRSSVDMDLEYRTDLFVARDGSEQRRSLRKTPRRRFGYTVTIAQADMRRLHQLMTRWQARPWLLPDPVRRVTVLAGAPMGANVIAVTEAPAWLRPGQTVIVGGETVTAVAAVSGQTVTLDAPLPVAVAAGETLRPGLSGLLSTTMRAKHPSNGAAEFGFTFDVEPGTEVEDAGGPSMWSHGGREVLTRKPNWGSDVETEYQWPNEQVDFEFGRIETYIPQAFPTMLRRADYVQQTAADARDLEQFFSRQRGQRGEFLMPTWMNDLPPQFDLVAGTNFIRVAGSDTAAAYAGDPVYQTLVVVMDDGRRIFRTVTGITAVVDTSGADSVVYVDGPWLTDLPRDHIQMVSWMPVTRMAGDQLTIEWLTDEVAQSSLALQSLPALPAENPVPAYDGAAQSLLETWTPDEWSVFDPLQYLVNVRYPEIVS